MHINIALNSTCDNCACCKDITDYNRALANLDTALALHFTIDLCGFCVDLCCRRITVDIACYPCRPRNARYVMKYKYARATQEMQDADEDYLNLLQERPYLKITEWSVNDITCEAQELGLSGSPTKVKNIESVVFQAKEAKVLEPSDTAIDEMMKELIVNHTVG